MNATQQQAEIEVLINQYTPVYYFENGFTVETRWNHTDRALTIAPNYNMLSSRQNETMPIFQLPFDHDTDISVIDMYNTCVPNTDFNLIAYDSENMEFLCKCYYDNEIFALPLSDIQKVFEKYIEVITKAYNILLKQSKSKTHEAVI